MRKSTQGWIPNQPLTTSRLAWLAARPVLVRRSRPWWLVILRVISASNRSPEPSASGARLASDMASEVVTGRMASYSVPIDRVAERLSPTEVAALRERGALPEWFFDAVEQERKAFLRSLK